MQNIDKTISCGWNNLDEWSETYIGAHWIIINKLPEHQYQTDPADGPLSQMVLIASHQLVEIMLFKSIQGYLEKENKWNNVLAEAVRKLNFNEAFNKWPKLITGQAFPKQQPFTSARELAIRRNATVHSESALSTIEMAHSALFTATETSRSIQLHFGQQTFQYESILRKYPLNKRGLFSQNQYPENKWRNK